MTECYRVPSQFATKEDKLNDVDSFDDETAIVYDPASSLGETVSQLSAIPATIPTAISTPVGGYYPGN